MGRQLVVFLDGTGNRFSHEPTNIVRLFQSVSTDPDKLLAYYDQGVGTFGLKETLFEWQKVPSRVCGLAFGWGLSRTVEGAYRFLAQHWQPGDEIFLFGFSRGAYAVRALAALMHAVGLFPGHEAHLFDYAWSLLRATEDHHDRPDFPLQARFKRTFGKPVVIDFVGIFDTVKSVGWVYDPEVIPYTAHNPAVRVVRHAVSIDERRAFYRQNLWAASPGPRTNLKEVWFAGVHSDVGGGYPVEESQVALLPYRWMLGEAISAGLRTDPKQCAKHLRTAPALRDSGRAKTHDSMTSAWKCAEWVPRLVWDSSTSKRVLRVGAMPPFGSPRWRVIPDGALIHRSVEVRLASTEGRNAYAPANLPAIRLIVDDDPCVSDAVVPTGTVSKPVGRSSAGQVMTVIQDTSGQ